MPRQPTPAATDASSMRSPRITTVIARPTRTCSSTGRARASVPAPRCSRSAAARDSSRAACSPRAAGDSRGAGPATDRAGSRSVERRRQCPFVNARLEEASLPSGQYSAVFSASAIHWIDPDVSWRKAADALVDGGSLALISYFGCRRSPQRRRSAGAACRQDDDRARTCRRLAHLPRLRRHPRRRCGPAREPLGDVGVAGWL